MGVQAFRCLSLFTMLGIARYELDLNANAQRRKTTRTN
jgi:hypothetical protein